MIEPLYLLDTNTLVYLSHRTSPGLRHRAEQYGAGELVTSSIVFAEFARGVDWSLPDAADTVDQIFQRVEVLPFDRAAARAYADLPFVRHRSDRLIAAHALALGLVLVTANTDDFRDLPQLRVVDWTR